MSVQRPGASEVERLYRQVGAAKLSLLQAGKGQGSPVVLLHGIPAAAELWREVMPVLAQAGLSVWAPDLPGYGQTRLPLSADFSLAGAADVLAAWLQQEFRRPVWLVGHDIGGGVAQILATQHPELLSHLSLGNTLVADSWPVPAIRRFRLLARLRLYPLLAAAGAVDSFYSRWELRKAFAEPAKLTDEIARRVFFDAKVADTEARRQFAAHLRALDNRQTVAVAPQLRQLALPVQLLWGKQDRFQPWETTGKRLAALLPAPATEVLEHAGHYAPLEQPHAYAAALLRWHRANLR